MLLFSLFALKDKSLISGIEQRRFISWMRTYNKIYTGSEYYTRLGIFLVNSRIINEHNTRDKSSHKLGHNRFSCYTPEEHLALNCLNVRSMSKVNSKNMVEAPKLKSVKIPQDHDWRKFNAVTPIQDQGHCGSCWTFSIVAAQEGQWAITHNQLYKLSEQNLLDCVKDCMGCSGGFLPEAYDWMINKQDGAFMLDSDYPYIHSEHGECLFDKSKGVTKITGWFYATKDQDEKLLAQRIYENGVASICIDAGAFVFTLYTGGIYESPYCDPEYLGHAVALVGYGYSKEENKDFWIIKNSWGTDWGEDGYIRIIRNKNNMCGVASVPIIPVNK